MRPEENPKLVSEVKRFRELWIGDDRFRKAVLDDPVAAAASLDMSINPAPLDFLWKGSEPPVHHDSPEARALGRIFKNSNEYLSLCDSDEGAIKPYRTWRARQRARAMFALGHVIGPMALHLPFVVELTRGCSVGCWFCGLSAVPLQGILETDLVSWKAMLEKLHGIFGASGVRGALYSATDPLDHPDYEDHGKVFRQVFGRFPATTTAMALTDLDRTRRLMRVAQENDCLSLRFSVTSRYALDTLYTTFSAEELVDIDLVLVNRESLWGLAQAGRARTAAQQRPGRAEREKDKLKTLAAPEGDTPEHNTICCVTGFQIDSVQRRIELVSMEPCTERWPNGYAVLDTAQYSDVEDFGRALEQLVDRNMGPELPEQLALQWGVTLQAEGKSRVRAAARGHKTDFFSKGRDLEHLIGLAEAFRHGANVDQTAQRVARQFNKRPETVHNDIETMWQEGVLIEPVFAYSEENPE